jgi:hypothetical protein
MTSKKSTAEINPLAFANIVALRKGGQHPACPQGLRPSRSDIFSLLHAAESALKGFLRNKGKKTEELRKKGGHQLGQLHETCAKEDLRITGVEALSVKNVIVLLDSGNDYQGFRYFTLESRSVPDLDWTSRVVGALVKEIKDNCGRGSGRWQAPATCENSNDYWRTTAHEVATRSCKRDN